MKKKISRGDLFYYDFGEREGSIQSGVRPVLVVQANEFNTNAPTIIVASLTTVLKKRYLPSHIILGKEFGLKKPSMVLLEQIQTIKINIAVSLTGLSKQDFITSKLLDRTINVQANCKVHRAVFDRLGEVLDELKRLEPSDDIDDELMDNISLILTVANGLYNPENHIESE